MLLCSSANIVVFVLWLLCIVLKVIVTLEFCVSWVLREDEFLVT